MGTNYYWCKKETPKCPTCGYQAEQEKRHIGKSSGGWVFALHVYPEEGIDILDDWKEKFTQEGTWIEDEYGTWHTVQEMLEIITERSWPPNTIRKSDGTFGLLRDEVDGTRCIGHGPGTWDYIVGEFS